MNFPLRREYQYFTIQFDGKSVISLASRDSGHDLGAPAEAPPPSPHDQSLIHGAPDNPPSHLLAPDAQPQQEHPPTANANLLQELQVCKQKSVLLVFMRS